MLFSKFYRSKDQTYYKNWIIETVYVYILGFIFYGVPHAKSDYAINIWFSFVLGSLFEQDHLLNLFIEGVYAERWPKCTCISIQKLM